MKMQLFAKGLHLSFFGRSAMARMNDSVWALFLATRRCELGTLAVQSL